MEGRLLLDVVVRKSSAVLELLSSEDESLLIWWDSLLVLDLGLDVLDGVRWLDIKSDGLASQGLDEDLHTTSQSQDEMESGLLLDVVVSEGSAVLELLSSEDESLLIRWDSLLVLDLGLDVLDGVLLLDLEGDGFSGQGLDEDLHSTSESQDEVKGGLLLDVVVSKGPAVLELFASEDESLLIRWDSLLVLDLGLHVLDGVGWLDIEGDGLSGEGLDEDLHTTSESEDQVESGLLLDVVVGESSAVLELLTGEDKSLLIRWDTLLVLDLGLHVLNGVRWLNIEGDGLSSQGLDEDLHSTSESEDQVESGLFLDVVVGKSSSILELFSGEDESLLVWWDTFLVLDLGLDIFNAVSWLNIEGDGLSGKSLDEDLHTTSQSENEMEG